VKSDQIHLSGYATYQDLRLSLWYVRDVSNLARLNTAISYILRLCVVVQLVSLIVLFRTPVSGDSSASHGATGLMILFGIICILILVDLATPTDPSRRRSKVVDSVMAIASVLTMGALVLYSLSMGTL
jgi:prepilin signal peptidase PulO-like enzyme (type II secretory pathway)